MADLLEAVANPSFLQIHAFTYTQTDPDTEKKTERETIEYKNTYIYFYILLSYGPLGPV